MLVTVNTEKLQSARVSMGLSMTKLSELSGLPANAVLRMETKRMRVNDLRLKEVAKVLQLDVRELIRKDG